MLTLSKECHEGWCINYRTKTDREYWLTNPTLSESLGNFAASNEQEEGKNAPVLAHRSLRLQIA